MSCEQWSTEALSDQTGGCKVTEFHTRSFSTYTSNDLKLFVSRYVELGPASDHDLINDNKSVVPRVCC